MNEGARIISEDEANLLYGVLRSRLNNLSVQNIRNTAAAAGIDVTRIPSQSEARNGVGSRGEVMPAIDRLFGELAPEVKFRALRILAEELIRRSPELRDDVQGILGRHGFQFLDGQFVPVGMLDAREARFLPPTSASELARAVARLLEGDESGSITLACGAVDLATQDLYRRHGWEEDPGRVAFQAKVNTALGRLQVFESMEQEFNELGMAPEDASAVIQHLREATNGAAQALQVLRRTMGDVHGSRPALRRTAYDAIKWASAIGGLFEGL